MQMFLNRFTPFPVWLLPQHSCHRGIPRSFTLEELGALALIELPLTVECIGNPTNGHLVATAVWTGFSLYDFLDALGLDKQATGVKYLAAGRNC